MTDNGLAALTERLVEVEESKIKGECISDACDHDEDDPEHQPTGWVGCGDAAAILGERGVFLPDGLDGLIPWTCIYCEGTWSRDEPITVLQDHIRVCDKHPLRVADATIATLRAALDGLVEAGRSYIDAVDADLYREGTPEDWWEREATLAALRAALATAKEAGG